MKSKGFTLIEIIISLAIFSVVAVIAIGALVRVTGANRQAQAIQSGVNNVSFIMDSMSRELRTGTNISCYINSSLNTDNTISSLGSPCTSNSPYTKNNNVLITFKSSNVDISGGNLLYAYYFNGTGAKVAIYKGQAISSVNQISDLIFNPILSPLVNISDYNLGVFGGIGKAQWIFIRLKGYAGIQLKDQSVFDVQTSISQRNGS